MFSGKKLLLVTGKGGIGKTLIAASIAQAAAESGLRTLVVEFGALDQIAPLYGVANVGHVQTEVQPNLFCVNIDPEQNFRDFVVKYLGQRRLFEKVISHRVVKSFINTIPGLAELMLLGRLYYECELAPSPRFDLVVFDGPASGHFLNMMATPDAVLGSNIVGPLLKETLGVRDFLAQQKSVGIVYVTVPEDLVVSETLDFLPRLLTSSPAELACVLINKVPRQILEYIDSPPLLGPSTPVSSSYEESCQQVMSYLESHRSRAYKALAYFTQGFEQILATHAQSNAQSSTQSNAQSNTQYNRRLDANLPIWRLPDLGAFAEPLPPGFWRHLLGATKGPLGEGGGWR